MRLIPLILAHAGEAHLAAGQVFGWWSWEPPIVIGLLVGAAIYASGVVRLWRHAGAGQGISRWEAGAFVAGWIALVVALISPIDQLGSILFSAHMAQHEIMMVIAAPLFAVCKPFVAFMWALPRSWRTPVSRAFQSRILTEPWHFVSGALFATLLHTVVLWLWHVPALFDAALENETVHAIEHLSFLVTAWLFWWALIHGRYRRLGYGLAVLCVFMTTLSAGALGALLTISSRVVYPYYQGAGARWGIDPLEDQQLGGLIMWVPAGIILAVAGVILLAMWLREAERRVSISAGEGLRAHREKR